MTEERPKRPSLRSFKDLEVYQRAQTTMARVHKLLLTFPTSEQYGLADQMRRASKSVGGLIAEGWAVRSSEKSFKDYLRRAKGSANEMESHLDTAAVLDYATKSDADALVAEYRIIAGQLHMRRENWKTYPRPPSSVLPPPSRRKEPA